MGECRISSEALRTSQVQCRPESLFSSFRAVWYSSSSSVESSQRSCSPTFPLLEVQEASSWTYSRGPDQGSFATSQSSFTGGVIEYVGGSDILTLFRRVGMPVSVDAIAVEDVPWERSLSTPGLTIGSRGGTGGAGGDSERESKFS